MAFVCLLTAAFLRAGIRKFGRRCKSSDNDTGIGLLGIFTCRAGTIQREENET